MLYASESLKFKHFETSGATYNFRLYDSVPAEFSEGDFFEKTKKVSFNEFKEKMYVCLGCGKILSEYVAETIQNLPAGGHVELSLYKCKKCGKYTSLEYFDDEMLF
ncbi:MAG: hypothetical protein JXL97_06245 [Bacteroidales bacterium]|nr:hypothetical protein [Bacteroidales bacterium]